MNCWGTTWKKNALKNHYNYKYICVSCNSIIKMWILLIYTHSPKPSLLPQMVVWINMGPIGLSITVKYMRKGVEIQERYELKVEWTMYFKWLREIFKLINKRSLLKIVQWIATDLTWSFFGAETKTHIV